MDYRNKSKILFRELCFLTFEFTFAKTQAGSQLSFIFSV